jgi:hypothetical protein
MKIIVSEEKLKHAQSSTNKAPASKPTTWAQKENPEVESGVHMYAGWKLDYSAGTATLCPRNQIDANITLDLQRSTESPLYEAWWPSPPSSIPEVVISGCCLLDGRWQIEFLPRAKKAKAACRRISHTQDREDAIKRLRNGHKASRIYMPTCLTEYHNALVTWQVQQLKKWPGCHVYYLLPRSEYHYYVSQLEHELGIQCPKMHELLDDFADLVKEEVLMQLIGSNVEVTFISPMADWGAKSPLESYLSPYIRASELCEDPSRIVGLEDLMENYLPREASVITGKKIPLLGGIVGNPHPFKNKALIDGQYALIELDHRQ